MNSHFTFLQEGEEVAHKGLGHVAANPRDVLQVDVLECAIVRGAAPPVDRDEPKAQRFAGLFPDQLTHGRTNDVRTGFSSVDLVHDSLDFFGGAASHP